jgi:hypothetical protein
MDIAAKSRALKYASSNTFFKKNNTNIYDLPPTPHKNQREILNSKKTKSK